MHVGTITVEMNLQSGDSEDEVRRNYQIKMQRMEEERAKAEEERQELARKRMQFHMEQAPVFGQLYLHIHKLGHADNIGERTQEQVILAKSAIQEAQKDRHLVGDTQGSNILIQGTNRDGMASTLNNRVEGTDDEVKPSSDTLARAPEDSKQSSSKIVLPKRNLFI